MTLRKAYEGHIDYLQILSETGKIDKRFEKRLNLNKKQLEEMYRMLVKTRVFDQKALKLQRQGRLLTYAPCVGEEAITVGSAYALEKNDWIVPAYREQGAYVARGVPLKYPLAYFMGFEEGNNLPKEFNITPISIPVATHSPHATGIGIAAKYKSEKTVVLTYTGDGGTSEGDFYEALNFAGVFKAPVIFVVRNNQWAISVPRKMQTAAETLAQKGIAGGIYSIQVDGNDIFSVYYATRNAIERARKGEGATLIEAVSYRMSMHTTADDPTRYRTEKETEEWKAKDPVERMRKYLKAKKIITERQDKSIWETAEKEVDQAIKDAESFRTNYKNMFEYVYAKMPQELTDQLTYLEKNKE